MPTVLVVEDNWVNRKMCHDLLADQFEVVEAESVAAAQEYLAGRLPDLILMDIQLPGMDGLTFTRQLKEDARTRHIPVVGVSAHAMDIDVRRAMEAGCADYITKPIDIETFAERVARWLPTVSR
jgi:two-component system cell cycle response regulator/two-component system cell cycle response regulator DivK